MRNHLQLSERGIATLPIVLIMVGIIFEVTLAGLVVSRLLGGGLLEEQLATEALMAAKSGAQDAVMRVTRYINCPDSGYCPSPYSLSVGQYEACYNILDDSLGTSTQTGLTTIYSRGTARGRERMVEVVLEVSTSTVGEVRIRSFREVGTFGASGGFDECD
ncbi:MAG: hypothetical protein A2Y84_01680 [Candidatus Colwellbacteria bacterium RBG_13_48_8]|uniref:Uncharacterized protein n=1 Tax=Candidatus Colwellbacteria bacterium RBG_13_48_8 TaxID=1797685 RepID=A0A1G1YWS5_9BACT|nr:MAG: hypothetical protein A2Y84_01680 [Candidatus Colwellbacteria bacterium RBG_13_48_8]